MSESRTPGAVMMSGPVESIATVTIPANTVKVGDTVRFTLTWMSEAEWGIEIASVQCTEKHQRRMFGRRVRCERLAHSGTTHAWYPPGGKSVLIWPGVPSRLHPPVKHSR